MYRIRYWAVEHAGALSKIYHCLEWLLLKMAPLLTRIGFDRLEAPVFAFERRVKGLLLDSQSCGQCIVGSTGMSCPMNCPKSLRNGPCGGVRQNGKCEILSDMTCVWVLAWQGNQQMASDTYPIQVVQMPVDYRLKGTSAWLREVRLKLGRVSS